MEGLGLLPPPSNDPVRQYKIDHAGQIDKLSFKASILPIQKRLYSLLNDIPRLLLASSAALPLSRPLFALLPGPCVVEGST